MRKTTLGNAGGSATEHNLSRQMFSVPSSDTFVSREQTSKEQIIPFSIFHFQTKRVFDSVFTGLNTKWIPSLYESTK